MKKKKIFGFYTVCMCIILMISVTACQNNKNKPVTPDTGKTDISYHDYRVSIETSEKNLMTVSSVSERIIRIESVPELRDFVSNVFIATIDNIDGCSTTVPEGHYTFMPYEYGQLTVLANIKGDTEGNTIKFGRAGGVISISDYEKGAPPELIQNDDKHRREAGMENIDKEKNFYKFFTEEGDIELEAGKTYLFFALRNPETGFYIINGAQYGSREIYQPESGSTVFRSMPAESSLRLKNNETGEYESLETFIKEYF